jgi:phage shock protein PspC (stress-responsive transcriptional regulator)
MTMKKIININLSGRVIPIEDSAYEKLQAYIESLRRYFANEEGRDEIINDIESRIAELMNDAVRKGASCITDADVDAIVSSMGRPEDFEAAGTEAGAAGTQQRQEDRYQQSQAYTYPPISRGRLYRNVDDRIIGGVCSGLANYFGIDPTIMRIIFVLLFGVLFWVYIVLWVFVPAKSLQSSITKRLYRSADDRVIGGVCGGLAAYFNIDVRIVRVIFALPLIIGLISGTFNAFWWNWDFGFAPRIISGSLGGTLFILYIILWIVIPVATTAAEKLEMRGEKIDLNSIRDTVRQTAQQVGERAKEIGQQASVHARNFAAEAAPVARQAGRGLGHAIGVLFKVFFLFVAAVFALALFGVFIGLLFGGFAVFPLKNFILEGFWQNTLAWASLVLFLGIPIIALITWLVRRIVGVKSKSHYLGYIYGSLWFVGLVCVITLAGIFARNFKTRSAVQEPVDIIQPATGKLYVEAASNDVRYYGSDWFGIEWDDDMPFFGVSADTVMLNTVRINVAKSKDSNFHVYKVRFSRGINPEIARSLAQKINFNIQQKDSLLILPKGFSISKNEKFRNQQVLVVIEVPVGKRIQLDRSLNNYEWFNVNYNRRGWNIEWNENWNYTYGWSDNVGYIMKDGGLEREEKPDELKSEEQKREDIRNRERKLNEERKKLDEEKRKLKDSLPVDNSRKTTRIDGSDATSDNTVAINSIMFSFASYFN